MDVKLGDALSETGLDIFSETEVTSSNPELRKLTRQFRIQRRLEKLQRGAETGMVQSSLQKQLDESAKVLTMLMREGDEIVTNVRVASDSREVDRREAECANRQKVMEQLENEAVLGQEMFEEITSKWGDVFECNDPIHIHEELQLQRERCNELIRQKDALIESLKDEVKNAEVKFTNDQQKQNEDIKSVGQRIEKQVLMMRSAFKEQLNTIEEVMIVENKTLYETNDRKWENLYVKTEKETIKQMREALNQMEKYQEGKEEVRLKFQEKHRASKILVAGAIQNLQLMQSTLKANVLLNQEKLDYNYQVLRKKEDENLKISSHQRRQINKLQDVISGLKRKIHDCNVESIARIESLTSDVKKLQVRVVEMENKAVNLSKINDRKYNQLWDLNVEDATKMLNKILTIDKLIHEQQLGLSWQVPKLVIADKHQLRSYCEAKDILRMELAKSQPSALEETILKAAYKDLHRHILQQVAGQTDFLVEDRVQEILAPFLDKERMLVKIDNVFQALRLDKVDDVDLLFKFFHQYAKCHICREHWVAPIEDSKTSLTQKSLGESSTSSSSSENIFPLMQSVSEMENIIDHALDDLLIDREFSEEQSTDSNPTFSESTASEKSLEMSVEKRLEESLPQANRFMCEFGHPLTVHPSKVLKALRQFVLMFNKQHPKVSTLATRLNQQYLTTSRLLAEEDVEIFWKQYRDAFGRNREQLWVGLLFGLKQYYEILKDRKQMNDEVMSLRKQNAELKSILHSYTLGKQETQRSPF